MCHRCIFFTFSRLCRAMPTAAGEEPCALWVKEGVVLHPATYMSGLWRACLDSAAESGSQLQLLPRTVRDLGTDLGGRDCSYDAVIVSTGAASGAIRELQVRDKTADVSRRSILLHQHDPSTRPILLVSLEMRLSHSAFHVHPPHR